MTDDAMETWTGRFEVSPGWALWIGSIGDGETHRHFAAQVVLSDEPVAVLDANGTWARDTCILIDPLATHRLAAASDATLVYIEPSRVLARELDPWIDRIRDRGSTAVNVNADAPRPFWKSWLQRKGAQTPVDARIEAATARINSLLPETISLTECAAAVALSAERFRHLFADETGLPFSRYVLWRRLVMAAAALRDGHDVTTAAHAAGFADSPHMARTLKTMFGVTASQTLLRATRTGPSRGSPHRPE